MNHYQCTKNYYSMMAHQNLTSGLGKEILQYNKRFCLAKQSIRKLHCLRTSAHKLECFRIVIKVIVDRQISERNATYPSHETNLPPFLECQDSAN